MLITTAFCAITVGASTKITVDPKIRQLVDEYGRARILHGFNVVLKNPPYLPPTDKFDPEFSITDKDLQYMKDWGVKIIRLGVLWEATEPRPGFYDMEYLEELNKLAKRFGDYGIYTLLDNHQDLFSRKLCGEGIPSWAVPKDLEDYCPFTLVG